MVDHIRFEPAAPKDAAAILKIHSAAIRQTAASYYSEDIINSWARPVTCDRIEQTRKQWIENPDHRMVWQNATTQLLALALSTRTANCKAYTFIQTMVAAGLVPNSSWH